MDIGFLYASKIGKGTRAEQFAADAYAHAGTRSQGICAQAIRQALERSTGLYKISAYIYII